MGSRKQIFIAAFLLALPSLALGKTLSRQYRVLPFASAEIVEFIQKERDESPFPKRLKAYASFSLALSGDRTPVWEGVLTLEPPHSIVFEAVDDFAMPIFRFYAAAQGEWHLEEGGELKRISLPFTAIDLLSFLFGRPPPLEDKLHYGEAHHQFFLAGEQSIWTFSQADRRPIGFQRYAKSKRQAYEVQWIGWQEVEGKYYPVRVVVRDMSGKFALDIALRQIEVLP